VHGKLLAREVVKARKEIRFRLKPASHIEWRRRAKAKKENG
jgi:hypothetical protein